MALLDRDVEGSLDDPPDGTFRRVSVTSQSLTATAWDSLWVDTNTAGGTVTITTPQSSNVEDGDRVEVGVEDASNDTNISANTGQSIIGSPTTLTTKGDSVTLEYKSSTSTWMIR